MKRWLVTLMISTLCVPAIASNEMALAYPSSLTVYAIVRNATGQVWEPAGNAFEAWGASGHTAADYDLAMTDKSGSLYMGDLDTDLAAGTLTVQYYVQAGGSPADTDGCIAETTLYWSGAAKIDYLTRIGDPNNTTIAQDVADVKGHLDTRLNLVISDANDAITNDTEDLQTQVGAAGAGLTALGDTRIAYLDAAISSRSSHAAADVTGGTTVAAAVTSIKGADGDTLKVLSDQLDATATAAALATVAGYVDTEIAAILEDTGTTLPGTLSTLSGYVDTEVAAIKAKTDNLPASPAAVGSAMTLSDDAITAAKFDETTAFPLKSADTGSTAVARTGADSDTLETLSDQIDGIEVGAGSATVTNQETIIGLLTAYEDFADTAYVETDANAVVSKGAPDPEKIQVDDLDWSDGSTCIYRDYGTGYFGTSFTHKFRINYSIAATGGGYIYPYALTNDVDDIEGLNTGLKTYVVLSVRYTNVMTLWLMEDGVSAATSSVDVTSYEGQDLYISITRTGGTSWAWTVGTTADGSDVKSDTLTGTSSATYRYFVPVNTRDYDYGEAVRADLAIDRVDLGGYGRAGSRIKKAYNDSAAILADTSAMDTSSELRTLLTGSDTAIPTLESVIDGTITWESFLEAQLSWFFGVVDITNDNSAGRTYTYYKQDGTTPKVEMTVTKPYGEREAAATFDPE